MPLPRIEPDEQFAAYHQYRRAVQRGEAEPIEHGCGFQYISGYGPDDEFMLVCYRCDVEVEPGANLMERIFKAVGREI